MTKLQELQAQLDKITTEIEVARKQEKAEALATIRAAMKAHGITAQELVAIAKKPAAIKYRNQETGDTWTGRGKEPAWIKGKDRAKFAV